MTLLNCLLPGQTAVISGFETEDESVYRLCEMGLVAGQKIEILKVAPFGDPIEVEVMNYRLCLRKSEASKIQVQLSNL
ncbi:MAG: ferrous iron transport protein A [Leptonema sp. (in: Bacteria)]|nr:ferrous iron transport protein A [Leptonema sp. (in: bacteria)]